MTTLTETQINQLIAKEVERQVTENKQKKLREAAEEQLLGSKTLTKNVRAYINTLSVEDQEEIDSILDKIIEIQSKYK